MKNQTPNTKKHIPETQPDTRGFTLVELLVVIAIIGILAGIVIPNVTNYLARAQLAAAVSDIRTAETSLTGMLSDTQRSDFRNWFIPPPNDALSTGGYSTTTVQKIYENENILNNIQNSVSNPSYSTHLSINATDLQLAVRNLTDAYTEFFYQLLRQGKNADVAVDIKPEIRQKLGNSYADLGRDPWDQQYQFWIGPMRGKPVQFFRSYRIDPSITDVEEIESTGDVYRYDSVAAQKANEEVPGSPREDWATNLAFAGNVEELAIYGFPAPKDLPVYIYSRGNNNVTDANAILQQSEALEEYPFWGGGDDINNWDKEQGWQNAPR